MVMTRKNWRWEELTKEPFELTELASEFELYNRTEGKSPKTIEWYNLSLKQFQRFLTQSEQSMKLGNLGEQQVREFILYLQEKTRWQDNPHIPEQRQRIASISVQTCIRALRALIVQWRREYNQVRPHSAIRYQPPAPEAILTVT
jgi:transposase InsO family protein